MTCMIEFRHVVRPGMVEWTSLACMERHNEIFIVFTITLVYGPWLLNADLFVFVVCPWHFTATYFAGVFSLFKIC